MLLITMLTDYTMSNMNITKNDRQTSLNYSSEVFCFPHQLLGTVVDRSFKSLSDA